MGRGKLTILLGPTAVGKTDLAIEMARSASSPVISCDSRQIFKEMKIGTAPPSSEQLAAVKHYFIFSHSVADYYTAGKYEIEALALLEELFKTHSHLIMSGGSGLYIDALCNGLDDFPPADQELRGRLMHRLESEGLQPLVDELSQVDEESCGFIDLSNPQRVVRALEVTLQTGKPYSQWRSNRKKQRPFEIEKIGLSRPRELLYERIDRRVDMMVQAGLEEEVRSLEKWRSMPALRTVGYREFFDYFDGKQDLDTAIALIKRNTRHYAKRQITWWARDREINWINL